MAPTVLCIGQLTDAAEEWQALGSKYTLLEFRSGTREEFLANCRNGVYDSVVGCYRSNGSTRFTGRFDAELVDALPKSWKYVAHNGAGYDTIDVDACSRRQIAVSNTPIAVDDATADVGIFLLLGALRSESYVFVLFALVCVRIWREKGSQSCAAFPCGCEACISWGEVECRSTNFNPTQWRTSLPRRSAQAGGWARRRGAMIQRERFSGFSAWVG